MLTATQVLAENNFGDTRTGGLAGPMGLFLILLLATATILLIRNMNARLRRLPDRFPRQAGPSDPGRTDATVADPTDGPGSQESSSDSPNGPQQGRNG
ncbi:hypothetical protein DLE60_08645 [Micromonospora globispora]|uniref:Uncharacterized protein n=1 Tax=Micromonospora globispora TaxID=1450148 RepID=A0A317K1E8_9ACTN|nr:hypothetical protein [Micromonospora globispora]PWU46796.1 hypothetical protein DLJ46_16940 [Micromonospora globispora]PWU60887.1 hypothetical protein DLE60_08645 [Micromonospora globispora]RQW91390.1 hypothetical protein DKL51_21155 [Micromonospora globispora]